MAKQVGLLKLVGTLGDISFYKSVYGFLARTKTGVDRKTILNNPRFARTRENATEFGHSAKAGKLIRVAFRPLLAHAKDHMTVQRLVRKMVKVVQSDTLNPRGLRKVFHGDLHLLKGFDFNSSAKFDSTFVGGFESEFNRASGISLVTIPPFNPIKLLVAPKGTTHFKFSMAVAALNFEALTFSVAINDTGFLPYDAVETTTLPILATLAPTLTFPVLQVLGVSFFQFVNGEYCYLQHCEHNALRVVGVY